MELGDCSSVHFIQAIKGGLVIKTPNTDSTGKPDLLFKKLKDIYDVAQLEDLGASSKLKWKDRYGKLALEFGGVKDESLCTSLVEKKRKERDYGDHGKDSEPDDLQFTLKQLKERRNRKKRKASNDFGLSPEEKPIQLEQEEDELDLMEPLSSLKSKISKSLKSKKNSRDISASPSSKISVSIKEEATTINGDSLQCTGSFLANTVKAEDPVLEYLESHMTSFATGSNCIQQIESSEICKDSNCELRNEELISFTEEWGSCTMNSFLYEHLEPVEVASLPSPAHILPVEVNNQEKTEQDSPVLNVPQFSEGYMKLPSSIDCLKEVVFVAKDMQSGTCNISMSLDESMEVDNQEKTEEELSVSNVPQFKEGYMKLPSSHDNFRRVVSPTKDQQSDMCNISPVHDEVMEVDNQEKMEQESSLNAPELTEGSMNHLSSHDSFKETVSPLNDHHHAQMFDISTSHIDSMEDYNQEKMEQVSPVPNVPHFKEEYMKHPSSNDSSKDVVSFVKDQSSDKSNLSPVHVDETMKVDNREKMEHVSSVLDVPQFQEGCMKHLSTSDCFEEVVFPVEDQRTDMRAISQSCSHSELQVSHGNIGDGSCCQGEPVEDLPPNVDNCSQSASPFSNCSSYLNPCPSLRSNSALDSEGVLQPSTFANTKAAITCLNSDNKFVVAGDDTQPRSSVAVNIEMNPINEAYPSCNVLNDISKSETRNSPGRLPSNKKAIAPMSGERLCLSMNSDERDNDLDHYKCREKVLFENYKASPVDSVASVSLSPQKNVQAFQTKSAKSPKEILKKQKNFKRGSPPKSSAEGPHLSRSFPRSISTGCTSVQGCSESAIAFSQRQMHDIETLATKLMSELKSVKEVVEKNLLFEAYRRTSVKNDADEVKNVIRSAEKVEETSRKWLSMMAKDCNRFCKIMRLTEYGASVPAPETPIQREKKVTFADEAGGTLCQVKLFENCLASVMESGTETCELQAE